MFVFRALLLFIILMVLTGCRNNPNLKKDQLLAELNKEPSAEESAKPIVELPEYYTPPSGAQEQPVRMRSGSFIKLDMQQVLKNERPVKLSDFGKEMIYHRITESIINIRNIFSIPEGYVIAVSSGSIFLYDKNFNQVKKLIEEDQEIGKQGDMYWVKSNNVITDFCYDNYSGLVFCLAYKAINDKGESSAGTIPLDELKNAHEPITPDGLKNKIKASGRTQILPLRNGYVTVKWNSPTVRTFNNKGDTMCVFNPVKEVDLPKGTIRNAESSTRYVFQNQAYFRPAYTDRIFRIKDFNTFEEVYQIDFGDKQVSPADGPSTSVNLADKLLMNSWHETDEYILIRFTQDYNCPNTRKSGSVKFHQAIYNKKTKEFYSFTNHKKISEPYNIPNDLDNGIDFWPNRIIDEKPYMVLNGKKYKDMLENKPNHTQVFPDITDDEVVLITIN